MKCNVKEKSVYFKFDGREYPLTLNFNVIAEIQDKYGDLDTCFSGMDKARNQIWLLCTLLNEAVEIHNEKSKDQWEKLTESQVGRRIDQKTVNEMLESLTKVVSEGLPDGEENDTEKNEIAE